MLNNLQGLAPWGPFPRPSQPRWFTDDGPVWLGMGQYQNQLASTGTPAETAADIVARLRQHGCEQLFWRTGVGGRRGKVRAFWDVRVAATATPATEAVPEVISLSPLPPPGSTSLPTLDHHPGVLQAYSQSSPERETAWVRKRVLGGLATVRAHAHCDYTHTAFAALAIDHFGSTISLGAPSRTAAESSLAHLVDLVLRDVTSS